MKALLDGEIGNEGGGFTVVGAETLFPVGHWASSTFLIFGIKKGNA